jgi:hypothetical protein
MKKFMITGGLVGFVLGLIFSLAQQSSWPAAIWRASVASFGAGILIRWWGGVWVKSVRRAYEEKMAAAAAKASPSAATLWLLNLSNKPCLLSSNKNRAPAGLRLGGARPFGVRTE